MTDQESLNLRRFFVPSPNSPSVREFPQSGFECSRQVKYQGFAVAIEFQQNFLAHGDAIAFLERVSVNLNFAAARFESRHGGWVEARV